MSAKILLNVGREKSIKRRHPWVFSKAIKKVVGKPALGQTVSIYDNKENWLAYAAYSPESQIRMRVWSFDKKREINRDFFENTIKFSCDKRAELLLSKETTGIRLVAGESDNLPGLTIDKYNNILVCQFLSAGVYFHKIDIVESLKSIFPKCSIYERSDVSVCKKEGIPEDKGWIHNPLPTTETTIKENGILIKVDVETGHKTGSYLDQRDSRFAAGIHAKDKDVLNCFSYTGAFSLFCAKGGAKSVTNVDVSDTAINIAKQNVKLNEISEDVVKFVQQDVFKILRQYREENSTFDMIILDPPKFAESKAQLNGACRGYKDINLLAMQLLKPGGTLLTFSCSGLMESILFQKIVADAALDAHKHVQIVERLHQAEDHPVLTSFPEGYYLKGLVCKVY